MAKQKMTFEKAFTRLEELVSEIEGGELSLDDALTQYGEAVKALHLCRKMLAEAEKKIEVLLQDEKGDLKTKAASLDTDEEGKT